jgi:hydroxymethylglutaryl-CoA reductase
MPKAVGTVGGMTRYHRLAARALEIMGVSGAVDLAEVIACVGLATNMAALLALCTEGIQRGHMRLHAKRA